MQFDQERPLLRQRRSLNSRAMDAMVKVAAVTAGVVMLISALVLSIVFVVGALAVLLVAGGYLWWKTRTVREQIRTQFAQGEIIEGEIIEGVVVRDAVADKSSEHRR